MTKENKEKFKKGYYVTVLKPDSDFTPAIFWVTLKNTVWTFSPGVDLEPFEHGKTAEEIINHFEECEKNGFSVIVSGY